jgi:hypothetical protein
MCHSSGGWNLPVSLKPAFARSKRAVEPGSEAGVTSFLRISVLSMHIIYALCPAQDVGHAQPTRVEESRREGNIFSYFVGGAARHEILPGKYYQFQILPIIQWKSYELKVLSFKF